MENDPTPNMQVATCSLIIGDMTTHHTPLQWETYKSYVNSTVQAHSRRQHIAEAQTPGQQSCCWVFDIDRTNIPDLQAAVGAAAAYYQQTHFWWSTGQQVAQMLTCHHPAAQIMEKAVEESSRLDSRPHRRGRPDRLR